MAARFADHPEAVAESGRIAERLEFDLTRDLGYRYPGSEDPGADRALAEICRARLEHRYAGEPEHREASKRLEDELGLIRSLRLSGFLLLHYDILELAREVAAEVRGADSVRSVLPPGRGRGSSVSSIVCYLTGLSHVDPVRNGLFLGRFLNEEIAEAPDIDLDFPRDIREKLIPRVHERYGRDRSALVAAFACHRSRGATRDFGKVLGLPPGEVERVARTVDMFDRPDSVRDEIGAAIGAERAASVRWQALARLARDAWGLPRHPSQHPGGMVISTRPLIDICPVQPAAMEGASARPVGQGLLRGRRLPEDRPARAGDAVGGGALRRRDRPRARRAGRPLPDPDGRRLHLPGDPGGRHDGGLPDRESGADADAAPHAAARPSTTSRSRWRWCAPGRSRAAPCIPISSAASDCARTHPSAFPTSTPRWSPS